MAAQSKGTIAVHTLALGVQACSWLGLSYMATAHWIGGAAPFAIAAGEALIVVAVAWVVPLIAGSRGVRIGRPTRVALIAGGCLASLSLRGELLLPALACLVLGLGVYGYGAPWLRDALRARPRLAGAIAGTAACVLVLEGGLQLASLWMDARPVGAVHIDDGACVIVCVGDSFTYGIGATAQSKTWPAVLERELVTRLPDQRIRVVNAGRPGANSTQVRNRLRTELERHAADIVLVCCGANNVWNSAGVDLARFRDSAHTPRGGQWLLFMEQQAIRVRLVRLVRLSWFRIAPPSQAISPRERARGQLALIPRAEEWLGPDLERALWQHVQSSDSRYVRTLFALGWSLRGRTVPGDMPRTILRQAQAAERHVRENDLDAAIETLGLPSDAPIERVLLEAWHHFREGRSAVAADGTLEAWRNRPRHARLAMAASALQASASPELADKIASRSLYLGCSPGVAYLAALRGWLDDDALAARQREWTQPARIDLAAALGTLQTRDPQAELLHFSRHMVRDPDWVWGWRQVGMRYALLSRFDDALQALDRALAIDAEDFLSLRWRGYSLLQVGGRKQGLLDLMQAVRLGADPVDVRGVLAGSLGGDQEQLSRFIDGLRTRDPVLHARLDMAPEQAHPGRPAWRILHEDLEAMRHHAREHGARFLVHDYPFHSVASDLLTEYAMGRGAHVVTHADVFEQLLQSRARDELFVADGHCNDAGYAVMGACLAEALVPVVREITGATQPALRRAP